MKIDTNLQVQVDTNLSIDKSTLKNLSIDKQAILKPNNTKSSTKSTKDQPTQAKKPLPKPKRASVNWNKLFKAIQSIPKGKKDGKTESLPISSKKYKSQAAPTASIRSLNDDIRYCILHRVRAELQYEGGERTVEIYCWGRNSASHDILRVYQTNGYSESGNEVGFKTFLTTKIKNFRILYGDRFLLKPGYRKYDEEMTKIYMQL